MEFKETIKQYAYLKKEVQDIENRINHAKTVEGITAPDTLNTAYERKQRELQQSINEIETFIQGVDDSMVRLIIRHRVIDGLSWRNVAQRIGTTESSTQKAYERHLKRCRKCRECP